MVEVCTVSVTDMGSIVFSFFAMVIRQSVVLSFAIPPLLENSVKWGTECLNTRFPLPNLLHGKGIRGN